MPPARIVPALADESVYLASESSLARVLREHDQNVRRGRAMAPKARRLPITHIATAQLTGPAAEVRPVPPAGFKQSGMATFFQEAYRSS